MAFVVRKREYDNFSYLTMICFFLGLKEGKAIERNGSLKIFCAVNCISETSNYQVGNRYAVKNTYHIRSLDDLPLTCRFVLGRFC